MRHSCAVALLQAGIDVSVIRDYLGHGSVATTSRYITTNLRMKREVLEAFWDRSGLEPKESIAKVAAIAKAAGIPRRFMTVYLE
jgi:hypothetical protein